MPSVTPEEAAEILRGEQAQRIPALFQHFGLEQDGPDAWRDLALALAARHVPGFQWNFAANVQGTGAFGGLGLGALYADLSAAPLKRKRGRPRKVKHYGGLLNMKLAGRRGRPALRTIEEKRQQVELWDGLKTRHRIKTDRELAEAIATYELPDARRERVQERARKWTSDISTWRRELKQLKNGPENPELAGDF